MKNISHFCLILVCSLYFSAANAGVGHSAPLKHCFSGEVVKQLGSKFKIGDVFNGNYEVAAGEAWSDRMGYALKSFSLYLPGRSPINNTFSIGDASTSNGNNMFSMKNTDASDIFDGPFSPFDGITLDATFSSAEHKSTKFQLSLRDVDGTVFDNTSFPRGVIPLSEFEEARSSSRLVFKSKNACLADSLASSSFADFKLLLEAHPDDYDDVKAEILEREGPGCWLDLKITSLYSAASCPKEPVESAGGSLKTFVSENVESPGTRIRQRPITYQSRASFGYEFTVLEDGIITGFEAAMYGTSTVHLRNLETNKLVVSTAITAQVMDVTEEDWGVVTIADFPVKKGERYRVTLRKPKGLISIHTKKRPLASYIRIERAGYMWVPFWSRGTEEVWQTLSDYKVPHRNRVYKMYGLIDIVMHVPAAE